MKTAGLYSGTVLVLGVVAFIESLAFSIPVSYFPNYAMSLGASVASKGIFTSSFMAASTLMSPKLGGLTLPGYGVPFYVNSLIGIASIIMLLAFVKETARVKSCTRMTRSNDLRTLE